jgi:hypothetical protein
VTVIKFPYGTATPPTVIENLFNLVALIGNPVPLIVIGVPPNKDPRAGLTEVIESYCYIFDNPSSILGKPIGSIFTYGTQSPASKFEPARIQENVF